MDPTGADRAPIERRPVVVGVLVIILAGFVLVTQLPILPETWRLWVVDLSWTAAAAIAGVRSLVTAKRCERGDRVAFVLFGLGALSWTAGMLVWDYYELWLGELTPFPSLADIGFLLAAPCFAGGLLAYQPPAPRPGRIVIRTGNLGMIATALAAILVIQLYDAIHGSPYGGLYSATALFWPMTYGIGAAFAFFALSADPWGERGKVIGLLALAMLVHAFGAMLYGEQLLLSVFATGGEIDGLWILAFALQYAAAVEQDRHVPQVSHAVDSTDAIVTPADLALPAVLIGLTLLTVLANRDELGIDAAWILVPVGLAFSGFLALRDGWVQRVTVALRTAEQEASRQLRAGERRLRNMFETASDGLLLVDDSGRVHDANPAAAGLLGMPVQELKARPLHDLVGRQTARDVLDGAADGTLFRADLSLARPGQGVIPVHLAAARFGATPDEPALGLTLHDLREQQAAEEARQRTARMEAIRQVSAGVAHDFNNLLTVIIGNAEILGERARRGGRTDPLSAGILEAAERCANLTRRLLAYTLQQPLQPGPVEIADVLEAVVQTACESIPREIELQLERPPPGRSANVDSEQLGAALTSLLNNAREAMPDGGTLRVCTSELVVTEESSGPEGELKPGAYIVISVSDTGLGMTPEDQARAFEPFFTTKPFGLSAGLGLSMVQGFVRQSGGHVHLSSFPGHGTTVTLWLPRD